MAVACRACLQRSASALGSQAAALAEQLAATEAAFDGAKGRADAVTAEVVGEVGWAVGARGG